MKSNARLRSSLRLSIDASPYHIQAQPFNAPDSASPHSSGFSAGSSKTSAGSQGHMICYALCLHDYLSDDPTHLPFNRNEILEIIAQEDTGWWAAMRPGEDKVGWISRSVQLCTPVLLPAGFSPFNKVLSSSHSQTQSQKDSFAYLLLQGPMNMRSFSLPAQLPRGLWKRMTSPLLFHSHLSLRETAGYQPLRRRYDFIINIRVIAYGCKPDFQSPPPSPPPVVKLHHESESGPDGEGQIINSPSLATSPTLWPPPDPSPRVPPSPTTPLPVPTARTMFGSAHSPIPISPRPLSAPLNNDHPADPRHQRSRSETLPPTPGLRHLRRRPMLLDDRSHLSRLSTLIESNDVTEIENFSRSPVVTDSFDAFHRVALQSPALRTGRVKTPIREAMSPSPSAPLPSASGQICRKNRTAPSWFLRPTYDDDDISLDYDGTVKAGTLPALVERLTLDYLSMLVHRHLLLLTKV